MLSHTEVVRRFMNMRSGRGHHVYSDGNAVYSYGDHFPMAVWAATNLMLINSDFYSSTTSRHQGILCRELARRHNLAVIYLVTESLKEYIHLDRGCAHSYASIKLNSPTVIDTETATVDQSWDLLRKVYHKKGVKNLPIANWRRKCWNKELLNAL